MAVWNWDSVGCGSQEGDNRRFLEVNFVVFYIVGDS